MAVRACSSDACRTSMPMTTASSAAALTRERLWELYPDLPDAERAALKRELDEIRVRGYALKVAEVEQALTDFPD